jgi:hypothetical protein
MALPRRSRRNAFIRRIQRHARISALQAGTLAPPSAQNLRPPRPAAALGIAGGELLPEAEGGSLPSALTATSVGLPAWNQAGRERLPVVMASLAPTPAPGEGMSGAFRAVELAQAAEASTAQPFQDEGLSASGLVEETRPAAIKSPPSTQAPPGLAGQKSAPLTPSPARPHGAEGMTEPSSHEEPAEVESASPQEDGIWKRLQTIFRKHAEKRLEEAQAETQADQAMPEEGPLEQGEARSETVEDRGSGPAKYVQKQETPVAGAPVAPGLAEPLKRNASAAKQPASERREESPASPRSASPEQFAPPGPGRAEAVPQPPRAQSVPPEPVMEPKTGIAPPTPPGKAMSEPGETPTERTQVYQPPTTTARNETVDRVEETSSPEPLEPQAPVLREYGSEGPEVEDEKLQASQPLPLEAAWPVHRQTGQRTQAGRPAAFAEEAGEMEAGYSLSGESFTPSEKTATTPAFLSPEVHAQVREALKDVSPGQPTGSSVEVIIPRRGRPAVEKEPGSEQVERGGPGEQEQPAAMPTPEKTALVERPDAAPESVMPVQDLVADSAEAEMAPEEVVDEKHLMTEIGPLPADLWELIGESPRVEPAGPGGSASPITSGNPAQREASASQSGKQMPAAPHAYVQRQAEAAGAQTGEAASPRSSGSTGAAEALGKQPPAEIDMDELARRVYGEVKKRLNLEWERMRRRF